MPAYGYRPADVRFLHETGVDPHEITTGKTHWGVRFATMGHYRVQWHPNGDGPHKLQRFDTKDGPSWRDAVDMPEIVFTALYVACKERA